VIGHEQRGREPSIASREYAFEVRKACVMPFEANTMATEFATEE